MDVSWYLVLSRAAVRDRRRRRASAPQPARVLLCLELMLNAGNLALVAFSRSTGNEDGQIFALIVMVVAACEVVVGLGLIVAMFRRSIPLNVDELRKLRGLSALSASAYAWLILGFPLAGSIVIAFGYRSCPGAPRAGSRTGGDRARLPLRDRARLVALLDQPGDDRQLTSTLWHYAQGGGLDIKLGILVDPLSVFMCLVVTGVSTLIHLYSVSLHDLRPRLQPLLQLPQLLRLLDAAAGPGGQLRAADRRLGVRRLRLLRADQLLVPARDRDARPG